jgi:hypothetical protein
MEGYTKYQVPSTTLYLFSTVSLVLYCYCYHTHPLFTRTSWIGHKTYVRCVLIGSANSSASSSALARSIEGACGVSPYLSALETHQSKLRTSLRRLEASLA